MARRPSVRYWSSRGSWVDEQGQAHKGAYCCWISGTQHVLASGPDDALTGPTYLAALQQFRDLLALANVGKQGSNTTVRAVFETYLANLEKEVKPGTLACRQQSLAPFLEYRTRSGRRVGDMKVSELKQLDIYQFMTAQEKPRTHKSDYANLRRTISWGPTTQRNFVCSLKAAFNWAVGAKIIPESPVGNIRPPSPRSRGVEALLGATHEEIEANHKLVMAAARTRLRPFIQVLKDTGARPGEIAGAAVEDFKPELSAILFHKQRSRRIGTFSHKTATKGKDRLILLAGESLSIITQLAAERKTGRLFVKRSGGLFTTQYISAAFAEIRKAVGLSNLTAYSYRHTFATEMLKAGMDIDTLAELMGNSAQVIREHYSHLLADKKALREKLERFRGVSAGRNDSRPKLFSADDDVRAG